MRNLFRIKTVLNLTQLYLKVEISIFVVVGSGCGGGGVRLDGLKNSKVQKFKKFKKFKSWLVTRKLRYPTTGGKPKPMVDSLPVDVVLGRLSPGHVTKQAEASWV